MATLTRVAAFDCGTNSLRLLIADVEGGRLRDVHRRTELVRLGRGVDHTGRFDPGALERTLAVTREYAAAAQEAGAERIRFVATSATRDAADRDDFLAAVERILGVVPETIIGEEEARLSFRGAVSAVDSARPVLVVDLGGGSTELVLGGAEPEQAHSMAVGSVRLTERHRRAAAPAEAAPTAGERAAIRSDVRAAVAASSVDLSRARSVVGVAATVLTVTAHVLRSTDRAAIETALPLTDVLAACDELAALSPAETAALPWVRAGREDVLAAGALIWGEVLRAVQDASPAVTSVRSSAHDILDGIALGLGLG
ncbi:exopolyphosphatase [Rathayibacter tritici]|uniref:Ppx/GppA phosphatase family protein n=1 Tax=Rathayibacter tritici TaxID=33888 RepID=UPI000CE84102|nr:exopolyphosphatase [Rathayibacter tritici]PPF27205.1 exopolyphosphatase [Rathayibacter tritici]PPF65889.1 exopolyphosphatase [Rathayibacter tritici]PPG07555.1 exopolyphosphatase [Rathayibacter tritici]PPI17373.1 exopolyphosphatase [Rathayibacter tritici]